MLHFQTQEEFQPRTVANRIYLMRSLWTLHTAGADGLCESGAIFHLSDFLPSLGVEDLLKLLSVVDLQVRIRFIDDTNAFAIVNMEAR